MSSLDGHSSGSLMSTICEPAVPPDVTGGLQSSTTPVIPLSHNPWQEEGTTSSNSTVMSETKRIPSPDSPVLDHPFDDVKTDVPTPKNDMLKVEILNEFDPLVSVEEKAARDAWADSEGHPPPLVPMKDLYISSPGSPEGPSHVTSPGSSTVITSPTPFASIASFAKNFALPIVKTKPQPLDESAKAVASPSTLSSFANQQDSAKSEGPNTGRSTTSGSSTPNRGGDDSASSSTKPNDATFDFQKFLDQMKTRSAEPVSRYLRS